MTDFLYRYQALSSKYGTENAERLILQNQVWATSLLDLNDPFDCSPTLSFADATDPDKETFFRESYERQGLSPDEIKAAVEARRERGWLVKEQNQQTEEYFREEIASKKGIVCFSKTPDHILMWSHYAYGHQGLCYQFDRSELENLDGFLPVDYQKDNRRLTVQAFNKERATDRFYIEPKARVWEYEEEIRMVFGSESKEASRWAPLPPTALKGVILGCRMQDGDKQMIRKLINQRTNDGGSRIDTFKAHPSKDHYEIIIPGVNAETKEKGSPIA